MIESIIVTVLPAVFLTVLIGGGELFRRRHVDMGGEPLIGTVAFSGSKYAILAIWAATILHAWGVSFFFVQVPRPARLLALGLWGAGFLLLLAGRLELGGSFRIGRPRERTEMQTGGLFRLSRNPMYLGVFSTLIAAVLHTMNPVVLTVAALVFVAHHRIVLAEEHHLQATFGEAYLAYCRRVRRYL
jgi:protein-S-isoprenylcysteine O-methyltransferase Ste14